MTRTRLPQPERRYARLRVTPVNNTSQETIKPIDSISILFLISKALGEWFGAVGGNTSAADVNVVTVEAAQSNSEAVRDVIIRFPASATPALLAALPISSHHYDEQDYRIAVVSHSGELTALVGLAGKGRKGWAQWVHDLRVGQE